MLLVDTNVVSEVMRAEPEPAVIAWMDSAPPASLFVSAVTQAEILYGISLLQPGGRQRGLAEAARQVFASYFRGRVLPFDGAAAEAYAALAAARTRSGRSISQFDAQIAATAFVRGTTLATRNVRDFAECGLEPINPWTPRH